MAEIMPASKFGELSRSIAESQVETAHRFPRDVVKARQRAITLACADRSVAESCFYRRPVGKDPSGKPVIVEGYSIRLAEIVAQCYGNIRVFVTLMNEDDPTRIRAHAIGWDLEANYAVGVDVVTPTIHKDGRPYDERMRQVIAAATIKKAQRDAIFAVIPKTEVKMIADAIRQRYMSSVTPEQRVQRLHEWAAAHGITVDRMLAAIGKNDVSALTEDDWIELRSRAAAIDEGEATIDELFPQQKAESTPAGESQIRPQPQAESTVAQEEHPQLLDPEVLPPEKESPERKVLRRIRRS